MSATNKQTSEAELDPMHVLRKNGKGLKLGPSKRKPTSVSDVEMVPGEPINFEELE